MFSPQLSFDLGGLSARLMEAVPSPSGTPTGGLTQSKGSSVEATIAKPGTLKLAFLSLSAKTLRTVGMLLAVLTLLGAAFIMFTITRRGPLTRMETIEARYGMLLIDGRASQDLRPSLVVVKTINDLAKIAEHHGGMIVHEDSTDRHWFRVDAGDTTYGYSFRTARTRPSPGPRQATTRLAVS